MLNPWIGIIAVLIAIGGTLGGLRFFQVRRRPSPEIARKLMHVLMAGVAMSFPWLFDAWWPVAMLCILSLVLLTALRKSPYLRATTGCVIHSVKRSSYGDLCFPPAILALFILAEGEPLLYVVPLLLLAVADPAAALIGARYGRARYRTLDGVKSMEGSIMFFVLAFLSVHIPLLLLSSAGRMESLAIAFILGVIVTLIEAVSWRGLDNLFVPIGGFLLLKGYLMMAAPLPNDAFALKLAQLLL